MDRIILYLAHFMFLVIPALSVAVPDAYPRNLKNRGLILPIGTGEVAIGPAWLSGNEIRNLEANWNFRYGLTENIEIARLGFRYRFLNNGRNQWAVSLQNYGIGYSESRGIFHHTAFEIEGKQQVNGLIALTNSLGYFWADSHEKDGDTSEVRISFSTIFRLNNSTALNIGYIYRDISGFDSKSANMGKVIISTNMTKSWDMLFEYRKSNFNEAVDSVLFNESYDELFSIQAVLIF